MTAQVPRFTLKRPCPKCPFRRNIRGYLRLGRAYEIAVTALQTGTFSCHETLDGEHHQCAGAAILSAKHGESNQMLRIAAFLGLYDPTILDEAAFVEVVDGIEEMVRQHTGQDILLEDLEAQFGWMLETDKNECDYEKECE